MLGRSVDSLQSYIAMRAVVVFVLALAAFSCAEQKSYDNYKVYRVSVKTLKQADVLEKFRSLDEDVDFWTEMSTFNKPFDVMVSPTFQGVFTNALEHYGIAFEERIANVGDNVRRNGLLQRSAPKLERGAIDFKTFHRYGTIENYLRELERKYSSIVSVIYPSTSSEGREIIGVKISTGGNNKPVILVDGGIHAREWIAPSMVLYIINQLVENADNAHLIANMDWYIIPVLNPDGYEYSHTDDRYWRKTRSVGKYCYGADGNRNFDYHWMETGASPSECATDYGGRAPMSEPEVHAISNLVESLGDRIKLYLTFHSYGEYLLYPWGYTEDLPDNWRELQRLGEEAAEAIENVDGTEYTVGSSTNVLYAAAGGSDDWVKGVGNVSLTYTVELPGNDFVVPPRLIEPIVEETWEGILVFYNYVKDKYVLE